MADADTSVAERDPDALAIQIERTREELARTIDTIYDRVSPARAARRAVTRARAELARVDPRMAAAAGAALLVGVTAFVVWRMRRR